MACEDCENYKPKKSKVLPDQAIKNAYDAITAHCQMNCKMCDFAEDHDCCKLYKIWSDLGALKRER